MTQWDGDCERSLWFHIKRAPMRLLLCGLLGIHTEVGLYSLNYKPAIYGRGPFGKVFIEYWPCKHCDLLFEKRVRSAPVLKVGHR